MVGNDEFNFLNWIDLILLTSMFSMLVVATSGTGFILGSGSSIDYLGLCCTCAGTMMVAASANSLNQVFALLLFNFFACCLCFQWGFKLDNCNRKIICGKGHSTSCGA